jgi:hypothetical protein
MKALRTFSKLTTTPVGFLCHLPTCILVNFAFPCAFSASEIAECKDSQYDSIVSVAEKPFSPLFLGYVLKAIRPGGYFAVHVCTPFFIFPSCPFLIALALTLGSIYF